MPTGYLVTLGDNSLDPSDIINDGAVTFTADAGFPSGLGSGTWTWSGTAGGTTYTDESEPGVYWLADDGNVYFEPDFGAVDTITTATVTTAPAFAPDGVVDGTTGDDFIGHGFVDTQSDAVDGWDGNDDSITAGDGNDTVDAGAGNDTIDGGSGTDIIYGGVGDDSIDGGIGADTLDGGLGADTIEGGDGDDLITDGPTGTSQQLLLNTGFDSGSANWGGGDIETNPENSYLFNGSTNRVAELDGAVGAVTSVLEQSFTVDGNHLSTSLSFRTALRVDALPNAGSEGFRVDVLDSDGNVISTQSYFPTTTSWQTYTIATDLPGAGTYSVRFTELGPQNAQGAIVDDITLTASSGIDTSDDSLSGGAGADTIIADGGNDTLAGGTGADSMSGGDGDDTFVLEDGFGADTIVGGETGETVGDTLDLSALTGPVTVSYTGDEAGTISDGTDTLSFSEIERLILTDYDDFVTDDADNDALNTYIDAGAGDDTIEAGDGNDTIIAGDGNDSIQFEQPDLGSHSIEGGLGTDTINWSANGSEGVDITLTSNDAGSFDYATGGDGVFTGIEDYQLTSGDDTFDGTAATGGLDLSGGWGNDSLTGGSGNDTLEGNGDSDTLDGGAGDDFLDGGDDNDSLLGGSGRDTIDGGDGADNIGGGEDADSIDGGAGNDTINAGRGRDTVSGGDGDDIITVGSGTANNNLSGDAGNDTITGRAGDDIIAGGTDDDILTGGGGDDDFIYNAGDGADTITDFNTGNSGAIDDGIQNNNDFIDLSNFYDAAAVAAYNAANGAQPDLTHELNLLREDAADGKLDGIINGVNVQFEITGLDLTLENGGAPVTGSNLTFDNTNVACFTRGTLINTESGEVRIEDLAQGDLVLTVDKGLQPIRWIGSNYLSKHLLNEHENLRPIRIRAGALADGLPTQDLLVSPQHRVLIRSDIVRRMFDSEEVLVAAKHLLQVDGIEIAHDVEKVEYFHFLFDEHELVMSNGATTESLYTGPEALKSVSTDAKDEILTLFPELSDMDYAAPPCRTLVKGRLGRRMAMRHSKNNKQLVHCDEQITQTF